MPDIIKEQLDSIAAGIKAVQDIADRNAERMDALDAKQIDRIADDVTKSMDEIAAIKAKQEATEKLVTELEKKAVRPNGGAIEICSESKAAFLGYLRRGRKMEGEVYTDIARSIASKTLLGASEGDIEMFAKNLVVGNNEDGGYFIRPEVANFMVGRIFETSPMRQLANVITISTESVQIPIDDNEAEAEWVGEIDTRSETDTPKIGLLEIHAHELSAKPLVSQRMLDDPGFDVESWLSGKVADIFARTENTAFVIGNGSKQPRGFTTYDAWTTPGTYERGKLEQRESGSAGDFDSDNLIDLQTDLLEVYQPDATWVMQRKTFTKVMQLKDLVDGNYLLNPSMLAQGAPLILLGKPVRFFDDIPAVDTDALAIAYGNFKVGYTIVDRIGIRVLRDPYTSKPFVKFYTTKRVGGDVTNYQAIKLLKLSA